MTRRGLLFALPLAVFAVLVAYFAAGLTRDPHRVESVLVDRPFPDIVLPPLPGRAEGFSRADLMGTVSLVNVWGSWCVACKVEHPFLMDLKARGVAPLFGIDWRERVAEDGPAWLARFGDPYHRVGADPESRAAIALGVTGAPETFVVDRAGVIRHKHVGPLTPQAWNDTVGPIVEELRRR